MVNGRLCHCLTYYVNHTLLGEIVTAPAGPVVQDCPMGDKGQSAQHVLDRDNILVGKELWLLLIVFGSANNRLAVTNPSAASGSEPDGKRPPTRGASLLATLRIGTVDELELIQHHASMHSTESTPL